LHSRTSGEGARNQPEAQVDVFVGLTVAIFIDAIWNQIKFDWRAHTEACLAGIHQTGVSSIAGNSVLRSLAAISRETDRHQVRTIQMNCLAEPITWALFDTGRGAEELPGIGQYLDAESILAIDMGLARSRSPDGLG
jgi:hypothetical protein